MQSLSVPLCIILVLGILAAGCASQPRAAPATATPAPAPTTAAPLTDPALVGTWALKGGMINGGTMPVLANFRATVTFTNDSFSGSSACNTYSAGYTLTGMTTDLGKTMTIGPIASTKKTCAATSNEESSYLNNLQNTATYTITSNKLMLRTAINDQLSYEREG